MAHKKAAGSTRNGRDSESKRLGVKRFGGETVSAGSISFVSAAPVSTRVTTLALARTTRCLQLQTDRSCLR